MDRGRRSCSAWTMQWSNGATDAGDEQQFQLFIPNISELHVFDLQLRFTQGVLNSVVRLISRSCLPKFHPSPTSGRSAIHNDFTAFKEIIDRRRDP